MDYGIAEAKNNLPKLVKAALQGERVRILNRGNDAVKLIRVVAEGPKKGFGSMPGLTAKFPAGWDSPEAKAEVSALFEQV